MAGKMAFKELCKRALSEREVNCKVSRKVTRLYTRLCKNFLQGFTRSQRHGVAWRGSQVDDSIKSSRVSSDLGGSFNTTCLS